MEQSTRKILVVDDEPDIALTIVSILEDAGYTVLSTGNGNRAEQLIETEQPDMIVLDMLLSGRDGREIARGLKARQATQHIPILMLSAHPVAMQEARAAGADDFLAKPFDLDELLVKVAAHLA